MAKKPTKRPPSASNKKSNKPKTAAGDSHPKSGGYGILPDRDLKKNLGCG